MAVDTFKPINQTISEIFSCDGIYKIPNYQRQYSWTNDELDALWTDLYEAYQNKNENNDCYCTSIFYKTVKECKHCFCFVALLHFYAEYNSYNFTNGIHQNYVN